MAKRKDDDCSVCTFCRGRLWESRLSDGRTQFRCSQCGKKSLSEYLHSPRKKESSRCRHSLDFALDRHARAGLVEYMQAKGCTQAQATRAMFRYVLTGEVFSTGRVSRGGRSGAIRIPRNPEAAAMTFPNLIRELALKRLDRSTGYTGRGFQSLVLSVGRLTVALDDEAKEGLVYAMSRLGMNHVDAARWLLANVRVPGAQLAVPLRSAPAINPTFVCKTSGRRVRSYPLGKYDPNWDDD